MVAFNDRRNTQYDVDDLLARLPLQPGDTVGKQVIGGRYIVRGEKTEHGREFVIHEALPNGRIVERDRADRRYKARTAAENLAPTRVYDI